MECGLRIMTRNGSANRVTHSGKRRRGERNKGSRKLSMEVKRREEEDDGEVMKSWDYEQEASKGKLKSILQRCRVPFDLFPDMLYEGQPRSPAGGAPRCHGDSVTGPQAEKRKIARV